MVQRERERKRGYEKVGKREGEEGRRVVIRPAANIAGRLSFSAH